MPTLHPNARDDGGNGVIVLTPPEPGKSGGAVKKGSRGDMSLNFVTSMGRDKGESLIIAIHPNKSARKDRHHWIAIMERQPRAWGATAGRFVQEGEIVGIKAKEMRDAWRHAKEESADAEEALLLRRVSRADA